MGGVCTSESSLVSEAGLAEMMDGGDEGGEMDGEGIAF